MNLGDLRHVDVVPVKLPRGIKESLPSEGLSWLSLWEGSVLWQLLGILAIRKVRFAYWEAAKSGRLSHGVKPQVCHGQILAP